MLLVCEREAEECRRADLDHAGCTGLHGECWLAHVEVVDVVLGDNSEELPGYCDECLGCPVEVDDCRQEAEVVAWDFDVHNLAAGVQLWVGAPQRDEGELWLAGGCSAVCSEEIFEAVFHHRDGLTCLERSFGEGSRGLCREVRTAAHDCFVHLRGFVEPVPLRVVDAPHFLALYDGRSFDGPPLASTVLSVELGA